MDDKDQSSSESPFQESWRREHEKLIDQLPNYEKHVELHPDDPWGTGMVRYVKRRLRFLEGKLGLATNR